tara:strand:+ start:7901 stop:8440 length:540 start_codon:yes stop_codon:yes gene_type:complete
MGLPITTGTGATATVMVTGEEEVLAMLRAFFIKDRKGARKAMRRASTKTVRNILAPAYRSAAPEDTGAMKEGIKKKAMKRSRRRIGSMLWVNKKMVITKRATAKGMELDKVPKMRGSRFAFFYPAAVEYGTPNQRAQKPLKRSARRVAPLARMTYIRELASEIAKITPRHRRFMTNIFR